MPHADDGMKLAILLMLLPVAVLLLVLAVVVWGPHMDSISALRVIALIVLAVSVVMLSGRGAWAVAGFNTMSENEKARYVPAEIARGCGLIMLGMAVFLAFFLYGGVYLFGSITALISLTLLGILYLNRFAAADP